MDRQETKFVLNTYSGHSPQQRYVCDLVQAARYFQGELPDIVWHYTSINSFKKIASSQSLMFTHVSSFDDQQEVERALRLMKAIIHARLQGENLNRNSIVLEMAKATMLPNSNGSGWYASSLTDAEDCLFHWENYGDGQRGVAIGFDFGELIRFLSPSQDCRVFPAQIIYETQRSIDFGALLLAIGLSHFAADYADQVDDHEAAMAFLKVWGPLADPFSIIFKEESFAAEKEWRLGRHISTATVNDCPSTSADKKRRWIIPRGVESDSASHILPISRIVLGAKCEEDIGQVRADLHETGHTTTVVSYSQLMTRM